LKKAEFFEKKATKSESIRKNIRSVFANYEEFCKCDLDVYFESFDKDVFSEIQKWINWNHKNGLNPATIRQYFVHLKSFLYHNGFKLTPQDVKEKLDFPKISEEEKHGLGYEEIQKIFEVIPYKKKALYTALISSGMRIGEAVKIKKKDLDLSLKRVMIKIPASYTKTRRGRTTFLSSEAAKYILHTLPKLDDNAKVWGSASAESESILFGRYLDKVGLGRRYDEVNRRQISLHSFRAYFITKISRFDHNLAKKLSGQRGYLLQYDRLSDEEKNNLYCEIESELLINQSVKDKQTIKKLQSESVTVQSLQAQINELKEESKIGKVIDSYIMQLRKEGKIDNSDIDPFTMRFSDKLLKLLRENKEISELTNRHLKETMGYE